MKLLDANVFIYAYGSEHPLKKECQAVLARSADGSLDCGVDVELFQELLHFYQYRRQTDRGHRIVSRLLTVYPNSYLITLEHIRTAARLLEEYPFLQSRDAVHAAVVFEHRLEGIISADRAFDVIAGLTRFDPKELAA